MSEEKQYIPKAKTLEKIKEKIHIELTNLMNYFIEPFLVFSLDSRNINDINEELKNLSGIFKTKFQFKNENNFYFSCFNCARKQSIFLLTDNFEDIKITCTNDEEKISYIDIFIKENKINSKINYTSSDDTKILYQWNDTKKIILSLKLYF